MQPSPPPAAAADAAAHASPRSMTPQQLSGVTSPAAAAAAAAEQPTRGQGAAPTALLPGQHRPFLTEAASPAGPGGASQQQLLPQQRPGAAVATAAPRAAAAAGASRQQQRSASAKLRVFCCEKFPATRTDAGKKMLDLHLTDGRRKIRATAFSDAFSDAMDGTFKKGEWYDLSNQWGKDPVYIWSKNGEHQVALDERLIVAPVDFELSGEAAPPAPAPVDNAARLTLSFMDLAPKPVDCYVSVVGVASIAAVQANMFKFDVADGNGYKVEVAFHGAAMNTMAATLRDAIERAGRPVVAAFVYFKVNVHLGAVSLSTAAGSRVELAGDMGPATRQAAEAAEARLLATQEAGAEPPRGVASTAHAGGGCG